MSRTYPLGLDSRVDNRIIARKVNVIVFHDIVKLR
jgi:hypothetical protein